MRKFFFIAIILLAGCAGLHDYPLDLSYQPKSPGSVSGKGRVTVAPFQDRRAAADAWVLGMRDNESRFITRSGSAGAAVSDAVAKYLESRGYAVTKTKDNWDGTAQALRREWGDIVVGGDIEMLEVNVTTGLPKISYASSVRLLIRTADPQSGKILDQQKINASSEYTNVYFSAEKAQDLLNENLAEAIERVFAEFPKKT